MNAVMSSDRTYVEQARVGDQDAYAVLVERYHGLLCALAYSDTGDVTASEDIAQEAFVIGWQRLGELQEPEHVRAWLVGIVRNLARNHRRKRKHDPVRFADSLEEEATLGENAPCPEEEVMAQEEHDLLWELVEKVPSTYREPLVLFYREDCSVRELAELLDTSEENARQRLTRGRKMLRQEMTQFVERTLKGTSPNKAAFVGAVLATIGGAAGKAAASTVASAATGSAVKATTALGGAGLGILGAIGGTLIGLAGAAFGVWNSLRNTETPREKRFLIKATVWGCVWMVFFFAVQLGVMFGAPALYRTALFQVPFWGTHLAAMLIAIPLLNRHWLRIRAEEGTPLPEAFTNPDKPTAAGSVHGALFGSLIGGTAWLYPTVLLAGEWAVAIGVFVVTGMLYLVGWRWSEGATRREMVNRVVAIFAVTMLLETVLLVFRWDVWASVPRHPAAQHSLLSMIGILLGVGTLVSGFVLLQSRWQERAIDESKRTKTKP